jgi:hypothetical protein
MSIINNTNTLSEKALKSYINLIDYTSLSGIEAVELMQAYINNGDYVTAQKIVDYYLENGLPFGRSSIVPGGIVYTNAKTPSEYLKFVHVLNKIYKYTQTESYNTAAQNFLTVLNTNMVVNSGNYNTEPLSTAVLLFDSQNNIITNYKSGTYVSDINPYSWYLYGYDVSEMVNCLFDSQKSFKIDYEAQSYGLFSPFYVRDLTENSAYGAYDSFSFIGPLGNENSLYHQYETGLNLAKYYYSRYKQNSDRDVKAKAILEKYFSFLSDLLSYYNSISFTNINTDDATIDTDDTWINTDALGSFALTDVIDLGNLARLGMSAIYKYQIDFEDSAYNIATDIFNQLIALQQDDGSIQETEINTLNQFLALQFLALYNKIDYKNWYDIINSALRLYNIPEINDNNVYTHEENYTLETCRIGMDEILGDRFFNFAYTNTQLPWVEGQYSWHLPNYNISMHKIGVVDFRITDPGKLYEPILMSFPNWKIFYDANPNITGLPLRYAINPGVSINPGQLAIQNQDANETIYVYPTPDHDYQINVVSYKLEPYIYDFNQYPTYLPFQWYQVLKYFIAYKIGINRGSPLMQYWQNKYVQAISLLGYWDANSESAQKEMPTNVSFGSPSTGGKGFRGFTPWEGQS